MVRVDGGGWECGGGGGEVGWTGGVMCQNMWTCIL